MKSVADGYLRHKEAASELYLRKYREIYEHVRRDNAGLRARASGVIEKLDGMLELQESLAGDEVLLEVIDSQERISRRIAELQAEVLSTKGGESAAEELLKAAKRVK